MQTNLTFIFKRTIPFTICVPPAPTSCQSSTIRRDSLFPYPEDIRKFVHHLMYSTLSLNDHFSGLLNEWHLSCTESAFYIPRRPGSSWDFPLFNPPLKTLEFPTRDFVLGNTSRNHKRIGFFSAHYHTNQDGI